MKDFLKELGVNEINEGTSTGQTWLSSGGQLFESFSPTDGKKIGEVKGSSSGDYEKVIQKAESAFAEWRMWPAPQRGEVVRQIGEALREKKEPLGKLVSYEMGKSYQEGLGEVQEMIDICDFAVGLCMSNIIRLVLWGSYQPSTFQWPCGLGTACSPGFVVMCVFGNHQKRFRCVPWPA